MHLKAGMWHYITFLENYLLLEMFEDAKGEIFWYLLITPLVSSDYPFGIF
jgi:hypothetical protein